jgi:integrase
VGRETRFSAADTLREHNKLTAARVAKLARRGRYSDGGGLVLQVSEWGTKAWVFRFEREGRERQMGLGPIHTLSLAEARERARECRKILLDGRDPIEVRNAERVQRRIEAARGVTFKDCAERYISAHEATWKNTKHRDQWRSTLLRYADPVIGALPVSAIDTALVMQVLEPAWKTTPETAARVRGRIEAVLDWATVRGFRTGDNPARWRGHLNKLLPSRAKVRKTRHHPALPYAEIASFMADLRARNSAPARALEFLILTAARTGEVIGTRWAEIDLKARAWTVPAERTKAERQHRIPLSEPALKLLSSLPAPNSPDSLLFPRVHSGEPVSRTSLLELMRELRPGYVPHGLRSTFRDWAAETTNHQNYVVEAALAHTIGDKVEAAYRRGDLFEKRRRLMADWARYCARPAAVADVLSMERRR